MHVGSTMKTRPLAFVAAWITLGLTAVAADAPKIAAKEAAKLVPDGQAILVDCREPSETKRTGVAVPAVLLPTSDFKGDQKQWKEFLAKHGGQQIILYCQGGARSGDIANALQKKGIKAANVGGLKDWTAAGLPTRAADAPPEVPKANIQK